VTGDAAIHALLALGARPRMPADLLAEVARRAASVADWDAAFSSAERHGLAPLLRTHLRAAGVALPVSAERQAGTLFLRHRRSNQLRIEALVEILTAFEAHGIDVRVLKGPALLSLVYGEPTLRPFSDLDLLVPRASALRGQDVLREIGFRTSVRESGASFARHHHLPAATRTTDGVVVQVELHHDALSKDHGASMALDETREAPLPIEVGGRPALALGPHDMIRHLSLHLVGPLPRPLRLIWIADVLGFAEACAARLDWAMLAARYPIVINVLGVAHGLTPLPAAVAAHVPDGVVSRLRAIANDAAAWSWWPARAEPGGHWMRFRRGLNPPPWWLTLKYSRNGLGGDWPLRMRHLRTLARVGTRRAPAGFREGGPR
jgi:hypothetical protein